MTMNPPGLPDAHQQRPGRPRLPPNRCRRGKTRERPHGRRAVRSRAQLGDDGHLRRGAGEVHAEHAPASADHPGAVQRGGGPDDPLPPRARPPGRGSGPDRLPACQVDRHSNMATISSWPPTDPLVRPVLAAPCRPTGHGTHGPRQPRRPDLPEATARSSAPSSAQSRVHGRLPPEGLPPYHGSRPSPRLYAARRATIGIRARAQVGHWMGSSRVEGDVGHDWDAPTPSATPST
jgi:hypothetical protein